MPRETMTPKERWLAVLRREKPDRIPMDYWATEEATQKLLKYLGCSDVWEMYKKLHIDPVVSVGPRYVGPPLPPDTDMYGCKYKKVDYGAGVYLECVYHPLANYNTVEEIEKNYTWPTPDWFDYSVIPKQIEGKEEYPIRGGGSEPFLVYKKLRGQEQAFMDLVLNPEMVHYCLDKLFDFCYENTLRIYEQIPGKVTLTYVAEDFGGQEDLMYSPEQIREFFIPRMKRMIDLAHEAGAYVFHHSDGAIRKIIPDMIEAGIDILNPIQWRCKGMEREGLKRDFGDKVVFHGGVDNQYTLAFGSVEEVRQEVMDNIRILGEGGGYILAPCHNIQAVSPPENIVAMYETGYEYGWSD
ncbi:MAG: uroporphyrinogen-III decarboxylase-like protein [Candidatus Latescibacterota bacterium]|nr:MAG: uroporphyrinogen-III decarboxylase-like protein [Candidatus Latescibacterota bacterium]HDI00463.1 uroporphyrinogen-III decarboxylase-like protein [Bacillota bacterium]